MMKVLSALFIIGAVGTFGARHTDLDINRIKRLPEEVSVKPIGETVQGESDQIRRTNDYDDHSSWYAHVRAPLSSVLGTPPAPYQKPPIQVYQPREDPRLFYQSDAYLKDNVRSNVNNEVTYIYPGNDVVRAGETNAETFSRIRADTSNSDKDFNTCVKCPHDRTLLAKASLGRVVLQSPPLKSCAGRKAPRSAKFVHMYGPKFGSLLEQGSHMVIGQIVDKNRSLQLCKMQVHVVVQGCVTPKYLLAKCWDHNTHCNFTCRNTNLELSGPTTQICGDDMRWEGALPVCKGRTWCPLPPPPEHGRVSCQGAAGGGPGLAEGARCRVRCARGWRGLRAAAVCRRGAWTQALVCMPRRSLSQHSLITYE